MLAFAVTLSRAASRTVAVDVTSDGSAQAGEDCTAKSGTLTFEAGEWVKAVEVAVLDDAHDEGRETLTLSNTSGAGGRRDDGHDREREPEPAVLLARLGRATAEQVVTHSEEPVGRA